MVGTPCFSQPGMEGLPNFTIGHELRQGHTALNLLIDM